MPDALPGRCEDGIRHGGRNGWYSHLPHAGRWPIAFDDIDLNQRHLIDLENRIVIEIALLDAAILERSFSF